MTRWWAGVGLIVAAVATGASAPVEATDIASQTCSVTAQTAAPTMPTLDSFVPITPTRLVDTRDGTGGIAAPISGGCALVIDLGESPVPDDAEAVALSVTGIADARSFLTVFSCASGLPSTSNVNTRAGGIPTPNLVVAAPDGDRRVCVYSLRPTQVVIDVTGWWTADGDQQLTTIDPIRADDSRDDPGRVPIPANTTRTIPLAGIVPAGAAAIIANLTVTEPVGDGFMTAFPCDRPVPLASNLNFVGGESRAVAVIVGLSPQSELCVRSNVETHVVLDVGGYYAPQPQFGPTPGLQPVGGQRLADSRTASGPWNERFAAGEVRRLRPTAGASTHSTATAVAVNFVVTEAVAPGFLSLVPCDEPPTVVDTSVVNFEPGGESTNLAVIDLADNGDICIYSSSAAHVVADLFGVVTAGDSMLEQLTLSAHAWPPYDPAGVDYIVECGSELDIELGLLRNVTARVNGVPVSSGTIDLATQPDQRITIELRRGNTVRDHSLRCVPGDFPRLTAQQSGNVSPGWYVAPIRAPGTGAGYAAVLDHRGVPVWYKRVPGDLIDVQRRDDGRFAVVQSLGPRYGIDPDGAYFIVDLAGSAVDERPAVAVPDGFDAELDELVGVPMPTDHHEYLDLPGGGYAVIVYPRLDGVDLSALGDGYTVDDSIADGVIQEVGSDGGLDWAWRTGDHFGVEVALPIRWGPIAGYPGEEVDVYHLNSIDRVDDGSGDYVVSARHMDNVFRVDRSTGEVTWVVGEVPADSPQGTLDARLTIVDDPLGGPRRPHDARLDGNLLTMFDNRTATGEPARALAYDIDTEARTATLRWAISDPLGRSSAALGSTRLTDEGTVVVSWGAGLDPAFGEYQLDGTPLLEIEQPSAGSYRFVKEPLSAFDADVLRANAGGTIQLDVP